MKYVPRLKTKYTKDVVPALMQQFSYSSVMQVPRLEKICINQGIGDATGDKKLIDTAAAELSIIAGQKAVSTKAKKSVSNFKLREGMPVGMMVTLRGQRMYDFLEKLISIVLPRVRDFRGISARSFDNEGNYHFGIKEHTIFPEVPQLDVVKSHGMQVTIKMRTTSKDHSKALLDKLGFPFSK